LQPPARLQAAAVRREARVSRDPYAAFATLDGTHPLRERAPRAAVAYAVRRVRGSRVLYFNFALAREMGLIPPDHPEAMTRGLHRALLEAFSLQIVNEYDLRHRTRIPKRDRLARTHFATRYLQLQHPDPRGTTSGDGRGIWNGRFTAHGTSWDVTSCGTGATRLCPATAQTGRFFKTGSRRAAYGCGTASPHEGLSAALMSEIFHRNGIATERVLAVLRRPDGFGITVRAGRNLLRPSHLFAPLRQGDRDTLAALVELFLERQTANGELPRAADPARRAALFAESFARTFGRAAATFEREYVFCWMSWDGDNILADGGIIDYGSVRQFGLFHREYRYDDGPRWSTTIPEQKAQARRMVRAAVQIREYLRTGWRPPLKSLDGDPALALFDAEFEAWRDRLLLRQLGFDRAAAEALFRHDRHLVRRFDRVLRGFERAQSARGPIPTRDGITWDAVYCVRDLLRELPARLAATGLPFAPREFLKVALSHYAARRDRVPTPYRLARAREFQRLYGTLIARAARRTGRRRDEVLRVVAARSAAINRAARITGDSIVWAAQLLTRHRRRLAPAALQAAMTRFIADNTLDPDRPAPRRDPSTGACSAAREDRLVRWMTHGVHQLRHGI
jgi:hypothetical protein